MKSILFLILFFTNLYSNNFGYFIKDYISEDNINFRELKYEDYGNLILDEFTIKFELDFEKLGNKTYYLTIVSDKDSLIYTNIKYEIINNIYEGDLVEILGSVSKRFDKVSIIVNNIKKVF